MIVSPTNYGGEKTIIFPKEHEGKRLYKGSFSKVNRVLHDGSWVSCEFVYCREYFVPMSCGLRRMFFVCERYKGRQIAALFNKIEDKLNITPKTFFGPTQRNNVLWIMPSPWWMDTDMKRSLFTAFLRVGQIYESDQDNLDDAIFGEHGESNLYTRTTSFAIKRFLEGHTRYMGSQNGWYHQFRWGGPCGEEQPSEEQISRLLRKPDLSDVC